MVMQNKERKKIIDFSHMTREVLELHAAKLSTELDWYRQQYALSKQKRFGASSEKTNSDDRQLSFFNEAEEEQPSPPAKEPKLEDVAPAKGKKQKGHKAQVVAQLPVATITYTLPQGEANCPACGKALSQMKQETRKELTIIPAKVQVTEHVRMVYVCRNCEKEGTEGVILRAKAPEPVFRNSLCSPSLLAHIMTRKYVEALPLYRQEQQFQRDGILISRQTMANWVIQASYNYLKPLYDHLKRELLRQDYLHADETTLEVLQEPDKEAQAKSYMWLYRSGLGSQGGAGAVPIALYEYTSGRGAVFPRAFLAGYRGYLQTDGYHAYKRLLEDDSGCRITLVGCFAHARRKYDEAIKGMNEQDSAGTLAQEGLNYINQLFALERTFAELTPEQRTEARQKKSIPVLDAYFAWAKQLQDCTMPKSLLGKAITYSINQEPYLRECLFGVALAAVPKRTA